MTNDSDESSGWGQVCKGLHEQFSPLTEGAPAAYIPELSNVDPDLFAIAAVALDGQEQITGDHDHQFTIQSISKLLLYGPGARNARP